MRTCEKNTTMTASKRHICLKYAQINSGFLFATCEKLVIDEMGNEWKPEMFKGAIYYRKTGETYRIAQSTLRRKSQPCNVLL